MIGIKHGCVTSYCSTDPVGTPLAIAKELYKHCAMQGALGDYILIDDRSSHRHFALKSGKQSRYTRWVTEEIELGRFTADELGANEQ